jgi:hypothetical protein
MLDLGHRAHGVYPLRTALCRRAKGPSYGQERLLRRRQRESELDSGGCLSFIPFSVARRCDLQIKHLLSSMSYLEPYSSLIAVLTLADARTAVPEVPTVRAACQPQPRTRPGLCRRPDPEIHPIFWRAHANARPHRRHSIPRVQGHRG